jgi:hypothetical protein
MQPGNQTFLIVGVTCKCRLGINSQAGKPSNLLKQVGRFFITRFSGFGFLCSLGIDSQAILVNAFYLLGSLANAAWELIPRLENLQTC